LTAVVVVALELGVILALLPVPVALPDCEPEPDGEFVCFAEFGVEDGVGDGAADDLSLFCRTIKESISGSHRGHGHAVVNVERNRKSTEYSCRFRAALIVNVELLIPPSIGQIPPKPESQRFIQRNSFPQSLQVYICLYFQNIRTRS